MKMKMVVFMRMLVTPDHNDSHVTTGLITIINNIIHMVLKTTKPIFICIASSIIFFINIPHHPQPQPPFRPPSNI